MTNWQAFSIQCIFALLAILWSRESGISQRTYPLKEYNASISPYVLLGMYLYTIEDTTVVLIDGTPLYTTDHDH
jgi:hypothetical protein